MTEGEIKINILDSAERLIELYPQFFIVTMRTWTTETDEPREEVCSASRMTLKDGSIRFLSLSLIKKNGKLWEEEVFIAGAHRGIGDESYCLTLQDEENLESDMLGLCENSEQKSLILENIKRLIIIRNGEKVFISDGKSNMLREDALKIMNSVESLSLPHTDGNLASELINRNNIGAAFPLLG